MTTMMMMIMLMTMLMLKIRLFTVHAKNNIYKKITVLVITEVVLMVVRFE